jgi:peroxiredoxin
MRKETVFLAVVVAAVFAGGVFLYRSWQPAAPPPGPSASAPETAPEGAAAPVDGLPAPSFTLPLASGGTFSSDSLKGKAAVVNFFATWCPPCREEIPGFVEVYEKYKDKGFVLVGISVDTDTRKNLPVFLSERAVKYPVVTGDLETARAYGGVSSIPATFFIGKDGKIRNSHVGYMDKAAFEAEVKKLL